MNGIPININNIIELNAINFNFVVYIEQLEIIIISKAKIEEVIK